MTYLFLQHDTIEFKNYLIKMGHRPLTRFLVKMKFTYNNARALLLQESKQIRFNDLFFIKEKENKFLSLTHPLLALLDNNKLKDPHRFIKKPKA